MKKFVLCIGTLGLAACGGGSSNHSGYSPNYPNEIVRIEAVPDTVAESNKQVTNMDSEVLVPQNGGTATNARVASGRVTVDGQEYMSYRLDDVEFSSDDKRIDDMAFVVDSDGQIVGLRIENLVYDRLSNSNLFESLNGAKVQYVGLGKNVGTQGLRYSDFGTVTFNPPCGGVAATDAHDVAFIGGYDVAEIDTDQIAQDMTFNGVASGAAGTVALWDNSAKLTFNHTTGDETLTASFDNWYDVSVTRDKNDLVTFNLVGENKNADGYATINKPTPMQDETQANNEGIQFSTDYYGASGGTVSEATALINYYQGVNTSRTNVSIGFGGVAQ